MKVLNLFILSFVISFFVQAEETRALLKLQDQKQTFKEGDLVEGLLSVWPIENADKLEFLKIQNKYLGNALYVSRVEEVESSSNNADVVEVKILFIVKKSSEEIITNLNYKGIDTPIDIPDIKVEENTAKQNEFYVLDQAYNPSNSLRVFFAVLFLSGLGWGFYKRESIISKIKTKKGDSVNKARKNYKQLFSSATSRKDFEKIYALKKEWIELVEHRVASHDEFFKIMEQHQYKKEWNSIEEAEVKEIFFKIRGSFK